MRNPQSPFQDELSRRRALKDRQQVPGQQPADQDDEDEIHHFSWSEIFAMIVAAYQVMLPILLLFLGVIAGLFLLFRFVVLR